LILSGQVAVAAALICAVIAEKAKAGRSFGVFWSGKATDQKGADLPE
jgi:hypothetical protein